MKTTAAGVAEFAGDIRCHCWLTRPGDLGNESNRIEDPAESQVIQAQGLETTELNKNSRVLGSAKVLVCKLWSHNVICILSLEGFMS